MSAIGANSDKAKKARDTLSSIYSFYAANRDSLDRVPSFLSKSSGDIPIIVQVDKVPSSEQAEALKNQLRELTGTKELIDSIPSEEWQMMVQVANASTIKRKENQLNK
ncbi:hypothetical protein FQN55_001287 [Onygenales sp. PD_40]|nr:hypothetical protein FQN55_001287 [Onygenales sp. PD_40]KAK2784126.1 hypothetical protein FQN52_009291 [Onygenales sp. PD_12]